MNKLVNFKIGRGGRFNNQGYLEFMGLGEKYKQAAMNENSMGFENEDEIIKEHGDDVADMITELDYNISSDAYKEFCEKYGNLGGVVLKDCAGNEVGDIDDTTYDYHFDFDGAYNTQYGKVISAFSDLTINEQEAIIRDPNKSEFELEFGEIEE